MVGWRGSSLQQRQQRHVVFLPVLFFVLLLLPVVSSWGLITGLNSNTNTVLRPSRKSKSKHLQDSSWFTSRTSTFLTVSNSDGGLSWMDAFLNNFCGDFDNYHQVIQDRALGLTPREGGGHEHIHCTLIPITKYTRLAAFYFDGNPQKIFRFRFYQMVVDSDHTHGIMKLYTMTPDLEGELRKEMDPLQWPTIFQQYQESSSLSSSCSLSSPIVQELLKCDVQWNTIPDPVQHEYALQAYPNRDGYHAIMVHGEAIVNSTMMPGQNILIRDQLSLYNDEFWIHDRGYDPETMTYIYGNQRGVPYQLQRVTEIHNILANDSIGYDDWNNGTQSCRTIVNKDLQWTLGSQWRTEEDYQAKLQAISGVSSRLNS